MKHRMTRLTAVCLLLALLCTLLCSCSSAPGMFSEDHGSTYFHGVCEAYSGQRSCTLTVGDNACISIQCDFSCKGGTLQVCIADEDGNRAFYSDGISRNATFSVQLTEPGTYTISVDAANYTGGFSFDWETVGAAAPG